MLTDLPEDVKRFVWERDKYRCRECGVAVAKERGCCPQTHHIIPRARGGSDDPTNLITLCFPCHATKASAGHLELLRAAAPDRLPEFVKHMFWDLGLNLFGFAECINPRRFNAQRVLDDSEAWIR